MLRSHTPISCSLLPLLFLLLFMSSFFFFNDTATTEIYTLSLTTLFRSPGWVGTTLGHLVQAAPRLERPPPRETVARAFAAYHAHRSDRKSTRLNSSH